MMKLLTLISVCLLFTIRAYSQDYLVKSNGDTLKGKIKPLYYDLMDRVQVTHDKKKTNLTAVQVRSFSLNAEIYKPMRLDNTIRFMKVIKPGGYLTLYAFRLETQTRFDGRYLGKGNGSGIEVPNLTFKKTMATFVKDCPEVSEKLEKGELGRSDLDKILDQYNNCVEQSRVQKQSVETAIEKSEESIVILNRLKNNINDQPDFASKQSALELINDISAKLKKGESIPNYLTDALKGYLTNIDPAKENLEKFLAAVNK